MSQLRVRRSGRRRRKRSQSGRSRKELARCQTERQVLRKAEKICCRVRRRGKGKREIFQARFQRKERSFGGVGSGRALSLVPWRGRRGGGMWWVPKDGGSGVDKAKWEVGVEGHGWEGGGEGSWQVPR